MVNVNKLRDELVANGYIVNYEHANPYVGVYLEDLVRVIRKCEE